MGRKTTVDYAALREYKAKGHTNKEVAEHFGIDKSTAAKACRGITGRPPEHKNGYTKGDFNRDEYAADLVKKRIPQFEYIDGFVSSEGTVRLRCLKCGEIVIRSWITVRHRKIVCDNCERIAAEERKRQKELQRLIDADRKAWKEAGKKKATQLSFSFCKACGEMFFSERKGVLYCSATCARREHDAIKKDKRIRRIASVIVDKDITVESLYEISNGKCALCGGDCNWGDHVIRDDGTFVVGAMYPSIDHIKPISKGGLHEWSNVQLAHFACNSKKGNRV